MINRYILYADVPLHNYIARYICSCMLVGRGQERRRLDGGRGKEERERERGVVSSSVDSLRTSVAGMFFCEFSLFRLNNELHPPRFNYAAL